MKSLLQEGTTVEKAVLAAWEAAGQPSEFTVKVLDHGQRGFFGFSKSPAIVSITYKPVGSKRLEGRARRSSDVTSHSASRARASSGSSSSEDARDTRRGDRSAGGTRRRGTRPTSPVRPQDRSKLSGDKPRGLLSYLEEEGVTDPSTALPTEAPKKEQPPVQEVVVAKESTSSHKPESKVSSPEPSNSASSSADTPRRVEDASGDSEEPRGWDDAYLATVDEVVADALKACDISTSYQKRVEDLTLVVEFKEAPFQDSGASRSFYASMSMLLVQILKKQHKRRFRGYRILLTTEGTKVVSRSRSRKENSSS